MTEVSKSLYAVDGLVKKDASGKIIASVTYTDSDGDGKFDNVQMTNPSLFTADEVDKDLKFRSSKIDFSSKGQNLARDAKGNFVINPCKKYSLGSLNSAFNESRETSKTSDKSQVGASYEGIVDGETSIKITKVITPSEAGLSLGENPQTLYNSMDSYYKTLKGSVFTSMSDINENANKSLNGGFVLDPNASTQNGECKDESATTLVTTTPVVEKKPEAPKDEQTPPPADPFKPVGPADDGDDEQKLLDMGAKNLKTLEDLNKETEESACKDDVLTAHKAGDLEYKTSDTDTLTVNFKKGQWISKVSAGIYGEEFLKDHEATAALNKVLMNYTNVSDDKHIKPGTELTFPKVIEVNGKRYEAINCTDKKDVTDEELKAKADAMIDKYHAGKQSHKGNVKPEQKQTITTTTTTTTTTAPKKKLENTGMRFIPVKTWDEFNSRYKTKLTDDEKRNYSRNHLVYKPAEYELRVLKQHPEYNTAYLKYQQELAKQAAKKKANVENQNNDKLANLKPVKTWEELKAKYNYTPSEGEKMFFMPAQLERRLLKKHPELLKNKNTSSNAQATNQTPAAANKPQQSWLYRNFVGPLLQEGAKDPEFVKPLTKNIQKELQTSDETQKTADVLLEKVQKSNQFQPTVDKTVGAVGNSSELPEAMRKASHMTLQELAKDEYKSERAALLATAAKDTQSPEAKAEIRKAMKAEILAALKDKEVASTGKDAIVNSLTKEDINKVMSMTSLDQLMSANNKALLGSLLDYVSTSLDDKNNSAKVDNIMDKIWSLALVKAKTDGKDVMDIIQGLLKDYEVNYDMTNMDGTKGLTIKPRKK